MFIDEAREQNKSKDLFISLASKPGTFGKTVHNAVFDEYKTNAIYVPCITNNINNVFHDMKKYNVLGAGISMPYKHKIYIAPQHNEPFLKSKYFFKDTVNTIVYDDCFSTYNTDWLAMKHIFNVNLIGMISSEAKIQKRWPKCLILGNGAIAKNINSFMWNSGFMFDGLSLEYCSRAHGDIKLPNIECYHYDILINATPLGMQGETILENLSSHCNLVIDYVVNDTPLIRTAKENNIEVIEGKTIALHQAAYQSILYLKRLKVIDRLDNKSFHKVLKIMTHAINN